MTALGDHATALVGGTLADWVQIADGNFPAIYRLTLRDGREMVVNSAPGAGDEAEMLKRSATAVPPAPPFSRPR